ncbi:hypothetical protein B0H19DRAFT_1056224 [Mycena capillaripes]|nr:hypothetical protein B0H19DRAFT_1056224 [Mycena capillaripes]
MDTYIGIEIFPAAKVASPEADVSINTNCACEVIDSLAISEALYALREAWILPMPIKDIMAQVLQPAVFILQHALDPFFCGRSSGVMHLSQIVFHKLRDSLHKTLMLVRVRGKLGMGFQREEHWQRLMNSDLSKRRGGTAMRKEVAQRAMGVVFPILNKYGFLHAPLKKEVLVARRRRKTVITFETHYMKEDGDEVEHPRCFSRNIVASEHRDEFILTNASHFPRCQRREGLGGATIFKGTNCDKKNLVLEVIVKKPLQTS